MNYLDGFLQMAAWPLRQGLPSRLTKQRSSGVPCARLRFHLPQGSQSNGITTIPVLLPITYVGTDIYQTNLFLYALLEEIIGWLARVGPKPNLI